MKIDLNCDIGESCGNDAELMDFVSSVNIACGYHAGDMDTMKRTVDLALKNGVAIGAHPSYPDRENFGRLAMNLSADEISENVTGQVLSLRNICLAAGAKLSHVKPHGALYNQAAKDADIARTIANAVKTIDKGLILFGLAGSLSIAEAQKIGLRTASEVFADRTYRSDGSLTPRTEPGAMITDSHLALAQVLGMVRDKTVTAKDGTTVTIVADTICIHGDGENALEFARTIHQQLTGNGITIGAING